MSVANFIPEIWSTGILKERDKVLIAAKHCNTDYEGEIRQKGDRVKILTIGDVASYDYTRNADISAPDQLSDESQWLDVDQAKYCHVSIDDIDKAQANQNVMSEGQRKLGIKMADDVDSYIFGLHSNAGVTVDGTGGVTSANILSFLATLDQKMREANVPEGEIRYLEVSPAIYAKLILARVFKETANTKVIDGAEVPVIFNFAVFSSNNIKVVSGAHKCLVRTKGAITFASQLTETTAYRPERRFGDAIKSLQVFGAKVIRPKELILFNATPGAES